MEARIDPVLLWSRAAGVGLLGFLLGTVGHVLADGLLPSPATLTALLLFSVLVSAPMLAHRRPASAPRLVLMVVGGQTLVHLALTIVAGHRDDHAATQAQAGGTTPAGSAALSTGHSPGHLAGHLVDDLQAHTPMMAAHLAAAVLLGLWLAHGERCLWTLLALTGHPVAVAALDHVPLPQQPPTSRPHQNVTRRNLSRWRSQPRSRRGPPLPAC